MNNRQRKCFPATYGFLGRCVRRILGTPAFSIDNEHKIQLDKILLTRRTLAKTKNYDRSGPLRRREHHNPKKLTLQGGAGAWTDSDMQGGPVDELLDVAVGRPALEQLEVE